MAETKTWNPDDTRKNDPAYWAAALVLAIKNGNAKNERSARTALRRLGFELTRTESSK